MQPTTFGIALLLIVLLTAVARFTANAESRPISGTTQVPVLSLVKPVNSQQ